VDRLVEEEMKRGAPVPDERNPIRLFLVEFFLKRRAHTEQCEQNDELLRNEYKRVSKKRPMPSMDTTRYRLEPPENEGDLEEWEKAASNSSAQDEHMGLR
jgi:hypothetical protein